MVPPEEDADCLKIISQLPPLRGIDYHYDGTLAEQITDSKKVCCDKPFWK
jgi:hypothetical protein